LQRIDLGVCTCVGTETGHDCCLILGPAGNFYSQTEPSRPPILISTKVAEVWLGNVQGGKAVQIRIILDLLCGRTRLQIGTRAGLGIHSPKVDSLCGISTYQSQAMALKRLGIVPLEMECVPDPLTGGSTFVTKALLSAIASLNSASLYSPPRYS
jgi:hypothetical protein